MNVIDGPLQNLMKPTLLEAVGGEMDSARLNPGREIRGQGKLEKR